MAQNFSSKVFSDVRGVLNAILKHPFNRALAQGVLAREKFVYYMQQDSLYLIDFARALALIGARAANEGDISALLKFSREALEAERSLHAHYFKEFGVVPTTRKSPACLMYTAYLVERAATANLGEAMAAVLPCFWIYREVGNHIFAEAATPNPYAKWIETYSCPEFSVLVDEAVALADRLAEEGGAMEEARMLEAFMTASRLEYYFWDDAEKLNCWLV